MGFFIIFNSNWGKDEPQTLRYAIMLNCSMGADAGQSASGGATIRKIPEVEINRHLKDMATSEWYGYEGDLEWAAIRRSLDSERPLYKS